MDVYENSKGQEIALDHDGNYHQEKEKPRTFEKVDPFLVETDLERLIREQNLSFP
jgi:hypothetical protein